MIATDDTRLDSSLSRSNPIKVAFITTHQIGHFKVTRKITAAGVSTRLRALLPAEYLIANKVQVEIISLNESVWTGDTPLNLKVDLVFASKILREVAAAEVIKSSAHIPTVFDFCDNYFEGGEHFALQRMLLDAARFATANTVEMGRVLRRLKPDLEIAVIPDMIESERLTPRWSGGGNPLSLLAFGSKLTCAHLDRWLPKLAAYSLKQPIRLELLTLIDDEVSNWHKHYHRLPIERKAEA